MLNRRQFSKSVLGAGLGLIGSRNLSAGAISAAFARPPAQRSDQKCDLLIKGGTLIDPGQQRHAAMDIAVLNGKILEISPEIPEGRALRVFSAKGKIVTPGLIDIHQHCYDGVADCVNADHFCLAKGVTTVVDGGSAGYPAIANFRKYVINTSVTRIKALVNISPFGAVGVGGTVDVLKDVDPDLAAKAAEDNKPVVVGIKVRLGNEIQGADDVEFLKRGVQAAQATGLPLMAHIDGPYSSLTQLLPMLRRGDVYTHFLHAHQNGTLDANGKILPIALEARQRGVYFDVAQGRSHLSWEVAEKCLAQGFLPDTLSTDLTRVTASDRVFDLPTMVSKFMAIGVDMDKAIQMVTSNAARIFDYGAQIGTLKPGGEADISIFEVREGRFDFEDSEGKKRSGRQKLVSAAVVRHGELLVNET
jgi:dihydroorotase